MKPAKFIFWEKTMAQGSNIKNPKIKQKQSLFCKEIILSLLCTFLCVCGDDAFKF